MKSPKYWGMAPVFALAIASFSITTSASTISCDTARDATSNGNTLDSLRTVNVYQQYKKNKATTFQRSYVLKSGKSKCDGGAYKKIVFVFHGGGGSACRMRDGVRINTAAGVGGENSHPFVTNDCINNKRTLFVFPNGLSASDAPEYVEGDFDTYLFHPDYFKGTRSNPTAKQFNDGRDPNNLIDENKMVERIYNQLNGTTVNGIKVDLDGSIYTAGHSNGGTVQWSILANNPKVKATFMSAGLMPRPLAEKIQIPKNQAHIFMVHGKQEGMQLWDGSDKQMGAIETIEFAASQLGYDPRRDKWSWERPYPNQDPTPNDRHANYMQDHMYGSYPPKSKDEKIILLSELSRTSSPSGNYYGAGHCWHGYTETLNMTIEGEQVTEECTQKYASTFWMLYSFSEADKWENK